MKGKTAFIILLVAVFGLWGCGESTAPEDTAGDDSASSDLQDDGQDLEGDQVEITPVEEAVEVVEDTIDVPAEAPVDAPTEEWVPGEGVVGDSCDSADDCQGFPAVAKECLTDIAGYFEFPGGYCTATCTSAGECGPDAECADLMFMSYCLKTCDDPSDCRAGEGYICDMIPILGGGPYCIPSVEIPDGMEF
ncbi:MAG: hypothetical protein ABIJ56_16235 [Pseudomonadota bacterium]